MKASFRLARIAGIDVGVHYSWFPVLVLFIWTLSQSLLPRAYPGWSSMTYWSAGVAAALLLFASVLVHEFAHSLVAKARGFQVDGITLFLLGGVSNVRADAGAARDEFVISVVGPVTSLALAGLLWITLQGMPDRSPVAAVAWYLTVANLALAIFNMLPAFPLDGGRVLRSVVWGVTGNFGRATNLAAWGGRLVGFGLMALAVVEVFQGNVVGGLWIGLVGWFLQMSAGAGRREAEPRTNLSGVLVSDAMDRDPDTIAPDATLGQLVHGHLLRTGNRAALVCEGGRLLGIITLSDLAHVVRERWDSVLVHEHMTPAPLKSVSPETDLAEASQLLADQSLNQAPVLDGDRPVGLLTRAHVIRYMHGRVEPEDAPGLR